MLMWPHWLSTAHGLPTGAATGGAKSLGQVVPLFPLHPWGPSSALAHQRPFLSHAGTLPQVATGCIHHCPFNDSLETQLMSSFACNTAHLAAMEGTVLTVTPKFRSDSWESVYEWSDYSRCRGCSRLQGPRTRAWANVTAQVFWCLGRLLAIVGVGRVSWGSEGPLCAGSQYIEKRRWNPAQEVVTVHGWERQAGRAW